jgi:hypothetical protein
MTHINSILLEWLSHNCRSSPNLYGIYIFPRPNRYRFYTSDELAIRPLMRIFGYVWALAWSVEWNTSQSDRMPHRIH